MEIKEDELAGHEFLPSSEPADATPFEARVSSSFLTLREVISLTPTDDNKKKAAQN